MSEGNVYEAAGEVADRVHRAGNRVGEAIDGLALALELGMPSRRDRFAIALAGISVARLGAGPLPTPWPEQTQTWAAKVWELADALDAADPRKGLNASPATPADDGQAVDLDADLPGDPPTIDDIYGPRK